MRVTCSESCNYVRGARVADSALASTLGRLRLVRRSLADAIPAFANCGVAICRRLCSEVERREIAEVELCDTLFAMA